MLFITIDTYIIDNDKEINTPPLSILFYFLDDNGDGAQPSDEVIKILRRGPPRVAEKYYAGLFGSDTALITSKQRIL